VERHKNRQTAITLLHSQASVWNNEIDSWLW